MAQLITQILAAAFLLGICIFVHELGHFLAGKLVGIRPKIFSIGYGRGIWFKKIGRTIYQITAIPLGGYVQFYGDDITQEHSKKKKGDFFAAGPWRRITVALGGPGFSILFGLLIIFILTAAGWQPMSNQIQLSGASKGTVFQEGDKIIAVNGVETPSFEKIGYEVAFAESDHFVFTVERDQKIKEIETTITPPEPGDVRRLIEIRPAGERFLVSGVDKEMLEGKQVIEGDKLFAVDGKKVEDIEDLRDALNETEKDHVVLSIKRNAGGVISPEADDLMQVKAPLYPKKTIVLKNVKDLQTNVILPEYTVGEWQKEAISKIRVGRKNFSEWDALVKELRSVSKPGVPVKLMLGTVEVSAEVSFSKRNMLMMNFLGGVEPQKANLPTDFVSLITRSYDQTVLVTEMTLLGLYRIIQGKISFRKSVSGPVKIMAVAARSVNQGWETYWFLLAQITVILGIMNLLPIPVLDGGHVIFYLIEAVYKPLSVNVIATAVRFGMVLLITLGIYVIGIDIWDEVIRRFI